MLREQKIVGSTPTSATKFILFYMGKTYKHQDQYDYLHDNKELPESRLRKLLNYFNRINFWDFDLKIKYRKWKDGHRGGSARIKNKNYK